MLGVQEQEAGSLGVLSVGIPLWARLEAGTSSDTPNKHSASTLLGRYPTMPTACNPRITYKADSYGRQDPGFRKVPANHDLRK